MGSSLGALGVFKHVASVDLSFGLVNSRYQREFPFLGIFALIAIFTAIARLLVNSPGNPVIAGAVATFVAFWTSIIFSFFILLFFGLDAPERSIRKAVFAALSAYLIATFLFCWNLFIDQEDHVWIGQSFDGPYIGAMIYSAPYLLAVFVAGELRLRRRVHRMRVGRTIPERWSRRLTSIERTMSLQSFVSLLVVAFLTAGMVEQMVLSEDGGALREFIGVAIREISKLE